MLIMVPVHFRSASIYWQHIAAESFRGYLLILPLPHQYRLCLLNRGQQQTENCIASLQLQIQIYAYHDHLDEGNLQYTD